MPLRWGPPPAEKLSVLRGPLAFKIPSKPSGAGYDHPGRCEALDIFGPIRPRRPSKTRSGTKVDLYRLSAASNRGL